MVQNLNSKFELREYQKEALGRSDFYFNGYQKRQYPAQLLFQMATGSGKTLIMAANILQLYKQGYIFKRYSRDKFTLIWNGFGKGI